MANDPPTPATSYQFGDSELAAERLRRLAEAFEPSSRKFLCSLADHNPRTVVDLGCGPGYTTRLLAEIFPAADVLGLDSSSSFIELARRHAVDGTRFDVADVTAELPNRPYDLIYCRYLLTHLSEPRAAIDRWSRQLRPGGLLASEENEWIHTDEPAFARYLTIVQAMLADAGQRLYVGAELASGEAWPLLVEQSSDVVPIEIGNRPAAGMFLPNLATWRERPFVKAHCTTAELDRLRDDLQRLYQDDSASVSITFGRRRLVLARRTD